MPNIGTSLQANLRNTYSVWKVSKESVTDTESQILATPLTNRLAVEIQNRGTGSVFFKEITGVSTDDYEVPARSVVFWLLSDANDLFAICGTGKTADLRIIEFGA